MITITKQQFENALDSGEFPDKDKVYNIGNTTYIYYDSKWYKVE